MRTLVVYYSRSGTTRQVASAIARALGADVEEIVDTTPRDGLLGFLYSGYQSTFEVNAPIQARVRDPRDYDLVIVGTPVWASNVSSPVRAYLAGVRGLLPRVALFCTMGGRGSERALAKMEALCGASPVARLALAQRIGWREGQKAIQAFVEAAAAAAPPPRREVPVNQGNGATLEARAP